MSDEIMLRLPRERPFYRIAHLVLGGLAVRLDLTFEHLEDLQVALAELLERQEDDADVFLTVRVRGEAIEAVVGPFDDGVRRELEREDGDDVGLRRVLETVVDRVELTERDGGQWVELTKNVQFVRS